MARLRNQFEGENTDSQDGGGNDIASGGPPATFPNIIDSGGAHEGFLGTAEGFPQGAPTPDLSQMFDRTGVQGPAQPGGSGAVRSSGEAQSGETPRERGNTTLRQLGQGIGASGPNAEASPARPRTPTPMAGSSISATSGGGSSEGVQPFSPMGSPDVGSMATPRSRGLYGSQGGLQGGGLGVPLDPVSNQRSNPIDMLLELLSKSR